MESVDLECYFVRTTMKQNMVGWNTQTNMIFGDIVLGMMDIPTFVENIVSGDIIPVMGIAARVGSNVDPVHQRPKMTSQTKKNKIQQP